MTFNHGVEGSSPSALTKEINYLALVHNRPESFVWALSAYARFGWIVVSQQALY